MMILIGGPAGAGKTALLHALGARGERVIDLEGLARHRGSTFGATGEPQPRHRAFIRAVRAALAEAGDRRVWLEDEGPFLGSVGLPPELYARFASTPVVLLDPPRDERVRRLIETYGAAPDLPGALARIEPRLGAARARAVRDALEARDLAGAASILLEYYDRTYAHRTAPWPRAVIARLDDRGPEVADRVLAAVAAWHPRAAEPAR